MRHAPNASKSQENFASVVALLVVKPRSVTELARITGSHPQTIRGMVEALEGECLVEVERFEAGTKGYPQGRPPAQVTWKGARSGQ